MDGITTDNAVGSASRAAASTARSPSSHASEAPTDSTRNAIVDAPSVADDFTPNDLAAWQWLFTPADMSETPSVLYAGLTEEQERFNRWKGVQLIFRIGDYMRLGNHVTCTASIFLQRFYMRRAFRDRGPSSSKLRAGEFFQYQEVASTCIFLACKVEETHRKLHSIVEATMAMLDRTPEGMSRAQAHMYRADTSSRDYVRWKEVVLLQEERLLETLCFDLIIEQPHPIAIKACQRLRVSRDLAQLTILIINILLYGAVCTFHDAATLAACAFLKACQYTDKDPSEHLQGTPYQEHAWNEAFDVDKDEIEDAMATIEDQLAYHQERLAPPPVSVPQSSSSTPFPGPHVSTTAVRTPSHLAHVGVTGTSPLSLTPRQREDDDDATAAHDIDVKRAVQKQLHDAPFSADYVKASAGIPDTPMCLDDKDAVQRETRTDSFRPVSRHGSREELGIGLLPRLSNDADADTTTKAAATAAAAASAGPASDVEVAEVGAAPPDDPNEEAAALKVLSEQKDLDIREEQRQEANATNAIERESKPLSDEGSEEEGAL